MICSEQLPGEAAVTRPRTPPPPNATEEGTAKAALWLFLAGLAVAVCAGAVWGVLRLRDALLLHNDAYLLRRPPEIRNFGGLVTDEEVLRYLGLSERDLEKTGGVNLYSIDLVARRRDFLASHPAVTEFTMERRLPDRLVITIGERSPVARLGNRALAVDDDGRVFEIAPHVEDLAESLPRIFSERFVEVKAGGSVPESDRVALDVLRTARRADSHAALGYRIAEMDLTSDIYLDLVTTGNIRIRIPRERLGTPDSIEHCLRLVSRTPAGRVDSGRTLIVNANDTVTMQ